MLSRFKRIDTGYAPDELKRAITDYIAAFQISLDAAKAGRDTAASDAAMAEARLKMATAVKKYD